MKPIEIYRIFHLLGSVGNYYALKDLKTVFDKNITHLLVKTRRFIHKNIYMFCTRV